MNNPTRLLRFCFICIFITAAMAILIFESGLIQLQPLADDQSRYIFNIVAVALTLIMLPLAMKLLRLSLPRRQAAASQQGYIKWAVIRLDLLSIPLYFNIVGYYLLDRYATCGWLAMMAAVMSPFVWPSDGRMRYERETVYPNSER